MTQEVIEHTAEKNKKVTHSTPGKIWKGRRRSKVTDLGLRVPSWSGPDPPSRTWYPAMPLSFPAVLRNCPYFPGVWGSR